MKTQPAAGDVRRARRRAQQRRDIRGVALSLAVQRGYDHVTVDDIAAAADISTRTFFNYFTSKDDALVGPDADQLAAVHDAVVARPDGEEPLVAIRQALGEIATDIAAHGAEQWELRRRLVRATPALLPRMVGAFTQFEQSLTRAIAARTGSDPDRDVYSALAAGVSTAALRVALMRWRADAEPSSLPELIHDVFERVAAGLPSPHRT